MPLLSEKEIQFDFPESWKTSKFDDWAFYRRQFMKLGTASLNRADCESGKRCASCGSRNVAGTKGVDILAIAPVGISWFIEVKDYRETRKSSFEFLADEVALKVRDTLACLVAARIHANDIAEKEFAVDFLRCEKIRIVLHLEQPKSRSCLESTSTRRANVVNRLNQLVKAIDPRPSVHDRNYMIGVDWNVNLLGSP